MNLCGGQPQPNVGPNVGQQVANAHQILGNLGYSRLILGLIFCQLKLDNPKMAPNLSLSLSRAPSDSVPHSTTGVNRANQRSGTWEISQTKDILTYYEYLWIHAPFFHYTWHLPISGKVRHSLRYLSRHPWESLLSPMYRASSKQGLKAMGWSHFQAACDCDAAERHIQGISCFYSYLKSSECAQWKWRHQIQFN